MNKRIRNTDVDNWYNTTHTSIKLKKSTSEKFKTEITRDSRVFFLTLRRIKDEDIVNETITKAQIIANPYKSKKKKILSGCMLTINILLVLFVFYNFAREQGGVHPLSELIAGNPKWRYLVVAFFLYILTITFNTLKYIFLILHNTGRFRPWFSFKLASIGRYYDLITPLGSGGQPFEIYYMKKNGYSSDTATAAPMTKYMIWQFSFFLLCLIILILYSKDYLSSPLVLICAWIGLGIVLLIFLFIFLMSIANKFGAFMVVNVLKLLHKVKIIKNYRVTLFKVLKFVKSYQYNIKRFAKEPILIISEIIITALGIISNALIAYFIYLAFAETTDVSWWDIVCKVCICELASSFIPLPGGSGAQELSFNALIGYLFPEGSFFWAVLIWRILTYYIHLLQGCVILIGDFVVSKIKQRKTISKNANQTEQTELVIREKQKNIKLK